MTKTKMTKDVYTRITDYVNKQLVKGIVPWQVPWHHTGIPRNLVLGSAYQGMNVWLLASLGYDVNLFLTRQQIKSMGAVIRQGERGHMVLNWRLVLSDIQTLVHVRRPLKGVKNLPRHGYVYNIEQCADIPKELIPDVSATFREPHIACQDVIRSLQKKPRMQSKESKAYYNPLTDTINMPEVQTFESLDDYYASLFHQLIHCTGHHKRLYRSAVVEMPEFNWPLTSHEELTACIGGHYLQSYMGIGGAPSQYSMDYASCWAKAFADNPMRLFYAQVSADAAVQYLLQRMRVSDAPKGEDDE